MQRAIPSSTTSNSSAASLRRKLRRAAALGAHDRRTVARAAAWLVAVRLGLRAIGYQRLAALLARGLPSPSSAPDAGRAAQLASLLDIAARNALPPATCLPRALVLRRLLEREGLPAALRIGAARRPDGTLLAHAWVTCDGTVVGDAADIAERFAELVPGPAHLAALAEEPSP